MSYAICRIQKCGSSHDIAGVQIHNRRERTHSNTNPDIDFERSKGNYNLCSHSDGKTFNAAVDEIIEKEYTSSRVIRKDAVKMCEILFTSDSDFFSNKSASEQRQFFLDCYQWAAERWGESRIVSANVHLDEQTPHMHVCFVPLAESINKKTGEIVTTLNAHKAIGSGSKAFQQLQDDFYKAVGAAHGLERGSRSDLENGEQPRKNQRVQEYKSTTKYYQQQQNELQGNVQALQDTLTALNDILHTEPQNVIQSVSVPSMAKFAIGKDNKDKVLVSPTDIEQLKELAKATAVTAAAIEQRSSALDERERQLSETESARWKDYQRRQNELEQMYQNKRSELYSEKKQVEQHRSDLDEREQVLSEKQNSISVKEYQLSEEEKRINQRISDLSEIEERPDKYYQDVIKEKEKQIDELQDNIMQRDMDDKEIEKQIKEIEVIIREQNERETALEQQVQQLNRQNSEQAKQLEQEHSTNINLNNQLQQVQIELEKQKHMVEYNTGLYYAAIDIADVKGLAIEDEMCKEVVKKCCFSTNSKYPNYPIYDYQWKNHKADDIKKAISSQQKTTEWER